jgi:hypothetical protein
MGYVNKLSVARLYSIKARAFSEATQILWLDVVKLNMLLLVTDAATYMRKSSIRNFSELP